MYYTPKMHKSQVSKKEERREKRVKKSHFFARGLLKSRMYDKILQVLKF